MKKEDKIKISYSHYSKFKECGHRFLLENIIEAQDYLPSIYSIFGDAIHDTLKNAVKNELIEEEILNHFKYILNKSVEILKEQEEYKLLEELLNQGVAILKLLNIKNLKKKYIVIGVEEVIFENVYKNFYFAGFIDLILKDKITGKYIIIDWKTSTSEWDLDKKMKDKEFLSQMRFYKYFYSFKHNIDLDDIECKYVVLNRFKEKDKNSEYGNIQNVIINTDENSIEETLEDLAKITRDIHIKKVFKKSKLENKERACFFCPFKNGHELCDNNKEQYINLMKQLKS